MADTLTGPQKIIAAMPSGVSTWHEKGPFIWSVATALLIWVVIGTNKFSDLTHQARAAEQQAQTAQSVTEKLGATQAVKIRENEKAIIKTLNIVQQNQWHTKSQSKQLERIERTVESIQANGVDLTRKVQVLEIRSNPSYTGTR